MAASGQMLAGSAWMLGAALVTGERFTAVPSLGATAARDGIVLDKIRFSKRQSGRSIPAARKRLRKRGT